MATRGAIRLRIANMAQAALSSKNCENATPYKPRTMQAARLPWVYTQRVRAQYDWTQYGFESMAELLSMELVVVIAQLSLGLIGQAEEEADEYFALLQNYLGAHFLTTIDGLATGEQIELTLPGDQGLRQVIFDDNNYFAAVMNVAVAHERTITYQGIEPVEE